ncbi:hypothetical protein [Methanolobus sp. WCC4]|uniref:DUF7289 family protein n=1 Tax=Methanolobus sp. WCC4 TaxID=3125784 RepID=UPI0030F67A44
MKSIRINDLAVSSVIGISIILVISLLSIGLMILYTAPLISDTQDMAKSQKVEQAFTVLDSRTSKASLGESPLQTTTLTLMGENVEVYGDSNSYNDSRIKIIFLYSNSSWYDNFYQNHTYWNAWESYESTYSDFAGLEASMGSVRYYLDDREIAYEGGGVWSKYEDGGTIMTSPPEFHYNGETMTLPIVKVSGNDTISGSSDVNIEVRSSNTPVILYPNTSLNANFTNPISANKILIYIQSDFYDGWADYAETLTSTTATLDHDNKTAIIEMDAEPKMGTVNPLPTYFEIPALNHTNPEPFDNFSFFYYVEGDSSDLIASDTILTATSNTGKSLVYSFSKKDSDEVMLDAANSLGTSHALTYTDTSIGVTEIWETSSGSGFLVNSIGSGNSAVANTTIDLVSDSYMMYYDTSDNEYSWGPVGSNSTTPDLIITDDASNANRTQSLHNITQHYMRLLAQDGTIECTWEQKSNGKIETDLSSYTAIYDANGAILTYLHITSNELEIALN